MQAFFKICVKLLILNQCFTFFAEKPCEDFYRYACQNYTRDNSNKAYSEITQKLDYEMNTLLLKRMEYLEDKDSDRVLIYMKSCKNEKGRNLTKYFDNLKPAEGLNWPIIEMEQKGEVWSEEKEINIDVWSLLGQLQSYGLNNVIIKHNIIRNYNETLEIWLQPAENIKGDTAMDKRVLKSLLKALGVKNVNGYIRELKQTDSEWQQITDTHRTIGVNKELIFKDLVLLYPHLTNYLEQLLGSKELENISMIYIDAPEYFEYLKGKFSKSKQELQKLCNYLMLKFLYYLAEDSVAEFTEMECIKDLKNKLELAVNIFYYNHFFQHWSNKYMEPLENVLNKTKTTMMKIFQENHLNLTETQVQFLIEKLEAIKINIGNLPFNYNNNTREEYYKDLPDLSPDNYYKNHLLLLKHRFTKTLLNDRKQTHYIASTNRLGSMSSPYYLAQKNMVIIPFETLQKSFFHQSQNPMKQIANFGFVLAHELAHAFDTTSLQFDENGWFLTQSLLIAENENFLNSINCLQDQRYTNDIDERLADLLAVQVAYRVYKDYYADHQDGWQQNFFTDLAQFFCGKDDLEFYDHDSDRIRLQQIVRNFPDFSAAFGCRSKEPMNPRKKCRLY